MKKHVDNNGNNGNSNIGHISLFREVDKILIVGDAFTATKQESLLSVITESDDVKGPPAQYLLDFTL